MIGICAVGALLVMATHAWTKDLTEQDMRAIRGGFGGKKECNKDVLDSCSIVECKNVRLGSYSQAPVPYTECGDGTNKCSNGTVVTTCLKLTYLRPNCCPPLDSMSLTLGKNCR